MKKKSQYCTQNNKENRDDFVRLFSQTYIYNKYPQNKCINLYSK